MTHPRELEDDEMIEIAKSQADSTAFGTSAAYFKLYNTAKGAVFYFENGERRKILNATFDMQLENLYIVGEPDGATSFSFTLSPGDSCARLLKPVEDGEATGIQMKF